MNIIGTPAVFFQDVNEKHGQKCGFTVLDRGSNFPGYPDVQLIVVQFILLSPKNFSGLPEKRVLPPRVIPFCLSFKR